MSARRADVFFYGLFMYADLLRSMGVDPQGMELAAVDGFSLRVGDRASLVPSDGGRVHGVVMSLTLDELDRLYSEPDLQAYTPQAVLTQLTSGGVIAALCYNLPVAPSPGERNPEYAMRLRAVARHVGLPEDYIASI